MHIPDATPLEAVEHEQVVYRHDRETGLQAFIAIHDSRLGPAAGGCRRWVYRSPTDALEDALRLSRGMTFKNALADIPFGGGKSVIIGRPGKRLGEAELLRFGDWVESLGGAYVTAEDVGMRVADMRTISRRTRFVSGLGRDGFGGDPSPATAAGVFAGIVSAVRERLGGDSLSGARVAVQGLGNVGQHLCHRLAAAGAELVVTDLDRERVSRAVCAYGARAVDPDQIVAAEVDVFAPCALGGVMDASAIERLRAKVVAGSANNQLARPEAADWLAERGVLYAPDYIINAGGVISVAAEYLGRDEAWAQERIDAIPRRLERAFALARRAGVSTERVARELAEAVLRNAGSDPTLTAGLAPSTAL